MPTLSIPTRAIPDLTALHAAKERAERDFSLFLSGLTAAELPPEATVTNIDLVHGTVTYTLPTPAQEDA